MNTLQSSKVINKVCTQIYSEFCLGVYDLGRGCLASNCLHGMARCRSVRLKSHVFTEESELYRRILSVPLSCKGAVLVLLVGDWVGFDGEE
jgi:hypothetical protein